MIREAIKANGVEELFKEERDLNSNTVDLFDKEYLEKINKIKMPNTKIKIVRFILLLIFKCCFKFFAIDVQHILYNDVFLLVSGCNP